MGQKCDDLSTGRRVCKITSKKVDYSETKSPLNLLPFAHLLKTSEKSQRHEQGKRTQKKASKKNPDCEKSRSTVISFLNRFLLCFFRRQRTEAKTHVYWMEQESAQTKKTTNWSPLQRTGVRTGRQNKKTRPLDSGNKRNLLIGAT